MKGNVQFNNSVRDSRMMKASLVQTTPTYMPIRPLSLKTQGVSEALDTLKNVAEQVSEGTKAKSTQIKSRIDTSIDELGYYSFSYEDEDWYVFDSHFNSEENGQAYLYQCFRENDKGELYSEEDSDMNNVRKLIELLERKRSEDLELPEQGKAKTFLGSGLARKFRCYILSLGGGEYLFFRSSAMV